MLAGIGVPKANANGPRTTEIFAFEKIRSDPPHGPPSAPTDFSSGPNRSRHLGAQWLAGTFQSPQPLPRNRGKTDFPAIAYHMYICPNSELMICRRPHSSTLPVFGVDAGCRGPRWIGARWCFCVCADVYRSGTSSSFERYLPHPDRRRFRRVMLEKPRKWGPFRCTTYRLRHDPSLHDLLNSHLITPQAVFFSKSICN